VFGSPRGHIASALRWIARTRYRAWHHSEPRAEPAFSVLVHARSDELIGLASEPTGKVRAEISLVSGPEEPTFVQVVAPAATLGSAKPATIFLLKVRLPNSVCLQVQQASLEELRIIVQMVGRLWCSCSKKTGGYLHREPVDFHMGTSPLRH
jgi:hypothetical protein